MAKMSAKSLIEGIGKPVSQLALGTASYKTGSKEKCYGVLDAYVESGGTTIDTARLYSTSEEVIGGWMEDRSMRDRVIIVTKCGGADGEVLPADDFPGIVREELTTSLQMLRTDYVDLYLLHRDNPKMTVAEILEPLNHEIAGGRVHAFGASNWEYRRVTEANDYADKHGMKGFAVVSNNLSLAVPAAPFYPGLVSVDAEGERWHEETGVPLIPWSSQARGFFTGRYIPQMQKSDGFTSRMIEVYCTDENVERLARAKELGEKRGGYTAVEIALAWLLHKEFTIVPIVGPQTPAELASCVKATLLSLTQSEVELLSL